MDTKIKRKIEEVVNCFETGTPEGDYSDVTLFRDGPNRLLQVTYGKAGVTEYGGNLGKLLNQYVANKGQYAEDIKKYIPQLGNKPSTLAVNPTFISLLKKAGQDPIMKQTQDEIFDSEYWVPAEQFFKDNKFTTPLSMLVIYDSYIHSGKVPMFIRNRFAESIPSNGGNEKKWITAYVEARGQWLKFNSNPILRQTIYRTNTFKTIINNNDWNLEKPINANGVVVN